MNSVITVHLLNKFSLDTENYVEYFLLKKNVLTDEHALHVLVLFKKI